MGNAGPFLADHGLGLQRAHARKRRDAEHVGKKSAGQNASPGWSRASIARPDILARGRKWRLLLTQADLSSPRKGTAVWMHQVCSTNGFILSLDQQFIGVRHGAAAAVAERTAGFRGGGTAWQLHRRGDRAQRHPNCGQPHGAAIGAAARLCAVPSSRQRAGADGTRSGACCRD